MQIINGVQIFDSIYELNYNLINAMELSLNGANQLYDDETGNILEAKGKRIKVSIDPKDEQYAGQGEVILDLLGDIRIVTVLLGFLIDKKQREENLPFTSYFPEEMVDEKTGDKSSNLTIKFANNSFISTNFWKNKCLKFVELIFMLQEYRVDLRNFDIVMIDEKR